MNNVHICVFTSDAEDLNRKDRKDASKVLRALSRNPRISTWGMGDMGAVLWKTTELLKKRGLIIEVDEPYPYHKFWITDAGRLMLEKL